MNLTYALIGVGVLLIALAAFLFVQRSHLADEAYGLERELERFTLERKPEDRERYLRVLGQSSQLNTEVRNAGTASVACGVLGIAAASVGIIRLRKPRSSAPGSETRS